MRALGAISGALILALALACPAAADFAAGRAAYAAGDYAAALEQWLAPGEAGEAAAQFALGTLYVNGEGVEQDFDEALLWFEKAAEQGHAGGQYNLGLILDQGWAGMPDSAAAAWWRKAAAQAHAGAQYQLGLQNKHGWGVEAYMGEAMRWYRQAAEQNYASAQYNLGLIYANGRGVKPDTAEAAGWYRKAADQGFIKAAYNLGVFYFKGDGVEEDHGEAVRLYRQAAERGHTARRRSAAISTPRTTLPACMRSASAPTRISFSPICGPPWRPMKRPIMPNKTAPASPIA